jgi:hypothetical protein
VIVTEPALSALTNPVDDTVAMSGALVLHVTGDVDADPLASITVAVACTVAPATTEFVGTDTLTLEMATATDTSVALPVLPFTVAVTETIPPPTAVTRPDELTVASDAFEVLHATGRPVMGFPRASVALAVACVVWPTLMLELPRTTPTVSTVGTVTASAAEPTTPSTVAVIAAEPGATAVTAPDGATVATLGSEVDHETARPVIVLPSESRAVATACVV